jgi:hypothetical protein
MSPTFKLLVAATLALIGSPLTAQSIDAVTGCREFKFGSSPADLPATIPSANILKEVHGDELTVTVPGSTLAKASFFGTKIESVSLYYWKNILYQVTLTCQLVSEMDREKADSDLLTAFYTLKIPLSTLWGNPTDSDPDANNRDFTCSWTGSKVAADLHSKMEVDYAGALKTIDGSGVQGPDTIKTDCSFVSLPLNNARMNSRLDRAKANALEQKDGL